ncbi:MAG: lasso peptide biosynthesis B2 protein [Novosphingobium meiothermophilum]
MTAEGHFAAIAMPMPASDETSRPKLQRPRQVKVPLARAMGELPRLWTIGPRASGDLLRALGELALARIRLARRTAQQLQIPDRPDPAGTDAPAPDADALTVIERVSRAIAIVAPRVPWRSDCLVQCLAARRWLAGHGITARISIGMKREDGDGLLAHAWLAVGETIVTGGDIADFAAFPAFPAKQRTSSDKQRTGR